MVELSPRVLQWYDVHRRDLPWRTAGTSPWGVVVSEFMLQQTPVARVLPVFAAWLERWPTPRSLAAAERGDAVRAWGRLGYPRRALRLHDTAVAIVERHAGEVPSTLDELLALPGVGQYTARAVASFAFGQRHPVVDTNVRRVVSRVVDGRATAAPPSTARDLGAVARLLPADAAAAARFAAALMELGAVVCSARAPRCEQCPVADLCRWRADGRPAGAPTRPTQRYAGTDREARGRLLGLVRDAEVAVPAAALDLAWPDAVQRERAIAGLLADGLLVRHGRGYALPR